MAVFRQGEMFLHLQLLEHSLRHSKLVSSTLELANLTVMSDKAFCFHGANPSLSVKKVLAQP